MSSEHTFNNPSSLDSIQAPSTPLNGLQLSFDDQMIRNPNGLPLPPPAPKASRRAYRLTEDERRKREMASIARKLTFGECEDEEDQGNSQRTGHTCGRDRRRRDGDDNEDDHSMFSIKFGISVSDEEYHPSFNGQFKQSGPSNEISKARAKLLSPIRIHPAHYQPPNTYSKSPFQSPSSSSVVMDDSVKHVSGSRKRTLSDVWNESPSQEVESRQKTSDGTNGAVDEMKDAQTQDSQSDPFLDSNIIRTPFLLQLHRTSSHVGVNAADSQIIEPSSMRIQPFNIQKFMDSSLSSMQRSVSYSSYLVRTPNELRSSKSSKIVFPPRLACNQRSVQHHRNTILRHQRNSDSISTANSQSKGSQRHHSPFSISSNNQSSIISTFSNPVQAQPIDYFGNWSAASSPLTRAY